jgi:hypothetical protein
MKRKNIGTLGRVKRKLSDNENAMASVASGVVIQPKSCRMFCGSRLASESSDIFGDEGT